MIGLYFIGLNWRLILSAALCAALAVRAVSGIIAYLGRDINQSPVRFAAVLSFHMAAAAWHAAFILLISYVNTFASDSFIYGHGLDGCRYGVFAALLVSSAAALMTTRERRYIVPMLCSAVILPQTDYAVRLWVPALFAMLAANAALTVMAAAGIIRGIKRIMGSVTSFSVKQAIDNLDTGITLCSTNGRILLENRRMAELKKELCGGTVKSGLDFYDLMLSRSDFPETGAIVRVSGGRTVMFTLTRIIVGRTMTERIQITADDITALYDEVIRLRDTREELAGTGDKIRDRISALDRECRARALMYARTRLHDLFGQRLTMLLMTLRGENMTGSGSCDYRIALADSIISLESEMRSADAPASPYDELEALTQLLGSMNITLTVSGNLPDDPGTAAVFTEIIREAATNSVRHGLADSIEAAIAADNENRQYSMIISDNGRAESPEWREGGGISGMRRRLGSIGGSLRVVSFPRFTLDIAAPMR